MGTKQHKPMGGDLLSFCKLIITLLGLRDSKEKLTRYHARYITLKWNRNVGDFVLCFTVSQTPSLRN